ncbi:MAG: prepilin-type N-terminal cleavage/methylation domain-containing protein [Planctomycetota bacterium]
MRNTTKPCAAHTEGFTLVEVIVVVAVLALLAGLVLPSVSSVTDDTKASKILATVDTLKKACDYHHTHTGALATETTTSTATRRHELSVEQRTAGWKGPYLDHPLSRGDNPFNHHIIVYESFSSGGGNAPVGFDLLGSGTDSATGAGQYVMFYNIPEETAQAINDTLDGGIRGSWQTTGRVEYVSSSKRLNVFLFDV